MIDRRGSMRFVLLGALATTMASRAAAQSGSSGGLIAPPRQPMLYRRTVARELVDGQSLTVRRSFRIAFAPIAEGYLVSGVQSDVLVDAPASLARFAELEQASDESALFPIALNAFGQIQSPTPERFGQRHVKEAVARAIETFSRLPIPASEREQALRFASALQSAGHGITAIMPHDLFAPSGLPRRTEQLVSLPDGLSGRVETLFEGDLDSGTGLMATAKREIVTAIDDTRRTTREEWSLSSI